MSDWFKNDLTTLAFCWRLARPDGIVLGFTSHDRDLILGGLRYRSAPGMVPSAIERRDSLDADALELGGALTSNLISERDLQAGRWDGAQLRVSAVDWTNPDDNPVFLARGTFGGVESDGTKFSVTLRGAEAALDLPIVEETSPECRAELGDKRCRIDLAGRQAVVSVVSGAGLSLVLNMTAATGIYGYGRLRWLDGANAGWSTAIAASIPNTITLREPPPFALVAGERVMLTEGCDRRFATCSGRFQNAINFRGEPHLPGNDLLTRYAL
jgi:uncharacterized phage protein (TIGR02218 family)